MPLVDYDSPLIEIDLPDLVDGDTIIKRKAVFIAFGHEQAPVGKSAALTIRVAVNHYSSRAGRVLRPLTALGFHNREVELKADADTLMDMATGQILAMRQNRTPEEWQALCASYEQPVMIQTKYFLWLRDTQEINVTGLIRANMLAGIDMGKYA